MKTFSSDKFIYNAGKKSFAAKITDLGEFKTKDPFEMESVKTTKKAKFTYSKLVTNDDQEVVGWEYVSKPADNPNKEMYKCIIFND